MQHPGDATADQPADDATGATTSERWLSASSWTRKRFASWDRKACSCAPPCRCVRRKIGRFGVPVLYRSGASRALLLRRGAMMQRPPTRSGWIICDGPRSCATPHGRAVFSISRVVRLPSDRGYFD